MFPSQEINEESAARVRSLERRVARLETLEQISSGLSCIETQQIVTAGSISVVTFSGIPQTFWHLWLWINAGHDSFFCAELELTFNGDSASNYRWYKDDWFRTGGATDTHFVSGGVGIATSIHIGRATTNRPATAEINRRAAMEINIMDYTNTSKDKSLVWKDFYQTANPGGEGGLSRIGKMLGGGIWHNPIDPITQISITAGCTFDAGSTFSLMGLCAK